VNITIVGAGALGSHVVLMLRNRPEKLTVIDFDRVEQKNLLGQMHTKMGLRRNKAQALQQMMQGMFGVRVGVKSVELRKDNSEALLQDSGLVLDCTDNIKARQELQLHCLGYGTPLLHGALAADGTFGRVVWTEHFRPDPETQGAATCEGGANLHFHVMVAAHLVRATVDWLETGKQASYNILPAGVVRIA